MNNIIDNRYEVIEQIGQGGMAIVYKAKCLVLNRYVAIKVLRPEFRTDAEFIKRFRAEAQAAGSLSHTNIVSIYDVAQDGDVDYIVMEYVEGVTLKDYIDAKGVIPWKEAVDYAAQICAGLECAHKKGIVHKDIKPHNILITREGVLKITDFGIAKAINTGTMTSNTATIGSVHYLSPEQARGGYIDEKTDIYSLGVLLYEMVTGKLPFEGNTAVSIAMQHIEKEPVSPRIIIPEIPSSFENVILKAMRKSPSARYESATRMLVDLKKVYTGIDVPADTDYVSKDTTVIPKIKRDIHREEEHIPQKHSKQQNNVSSKKNDVLSVLAGVVTGLFLIAVIAFFILNPISCSGKKTEGDLELPYFVGMTIAEAEGIIVESDIKIEVEREERDDSKEEGEILSQSPKAGDMVASDATVKVIINGAKKQFTIPSVVNNEEKDAEKTLTALGLHVSIRTEPSDTVAEGHVISQTPEAGSKVSKDGYVTIYVSTGKEETIVSVPNLINLPLEDAKSKLLEEGLVWGSIIYVESDKPVNTVLSQEIKPNKEVKEKTSIDLKVSRGPVTTPPPIESAPSPSVVPSAATHAPSVVSD